MKLLQFYGNYSPMETKSCLFIILYYKKNHENKSFPNVNKQTC